MDELKKNLWMQVDRERDEIINLLVRLIRIRSENPPGYMDEIAAFIKDYLAQHGIDAYEVRASDDHPQSILASIGTGSPGLILNGHMDVVPAGDGSKWRFDPFSGTIHDGKIFGRGTSDMKGGLAGIMYAMACAAKHIDRLGGSVVFSAVPDEETMGVWGTGWLVQSGHLAGDACIVAEPTSDGDVEVGQKGTLWVKVVAQGVPAHGSLSPYVGENAIAKLLPFVSELSTLREVLPDIPEALKETMAASKNLARSLLPVAGAEEVLDHVTCNLGIIRGGTKINMVPERAELDLDFRLPIGLSSERLLKELDKLVKRTLGDAGSIEVLWRSEANYTDPGERIVRVVADNIEGVLGRQATATFQWASSDARYFRNAGIPTLQYGPANLDGIHGYNENVDVEDVINSAKVYLGAIVDYLRQ
ncbi:MAG: ArgE/DapE family deacylase [Bacillota bacterium]